MKVLVVEDDQHKSDDIIGAFFANSATDTVRSVRDAVIAIDEKSYDLIILDMALPTFAKGPKESGGTAQAQGGVEFLRALQRAQSNTRVIIVSQYPELEIGGTYVALTDAALHLRQKYDVEVCGAVLYEYETENWKGPLAALVG